MQKAEQRYFGTGCLTPFDRLLACIDPELPYRKNARRIADLQRKDSPLNGSVAQIKIAPYIYNHPVVTSIADYLKSNVYDDLAGAYVHGSTATGEITAYSDFDGLLIVRKGVVADKSRLFRLMRHLLVTRRMMTQFDPLQHHGWLILQESDLRSYDESYFPSILFSYAASLLDKGMHLEICSKQTDQTKPFYSLAQKIINSTEKPVPQSLYGLKSDLSEFMLLPALYIQAKTGKGIFKKFSFAEAAKDFPPDEWECMNAISRIRAEWNYKADARKELIALRYASVPKIADRFHTKAPTGLAEKVNALQPAMQTLALAMRNTISSLNSPGGEAASLPPLQ